MNKVKYEPINLEIIKFETEDVIMTSGADEFDPHEYEAPIIPGH